MQVAIAGCSCKSVLFFSSLPNPALVSLTEEQCVQGTGKHAKVERFNFLGVAPADYRRGSTGIENGRGGSPDAARQVQRVAAYSALPAAERPRASGGQPSCCACQVRLSPPWSGKIRVLKCPRMYHCLLGVHTCSAASQPGTIQSCKNCQPSTFSPCHHHPGVNAGKGRQYMWLTC